MKEKRISKQAQIRFRWMEHYAKYRSARLTCRHFGISPDTFYLWKKRYNPEDISSLEDTLSRRPKTLRKAKWDYQTLILLKRLLEHSPDIKQTGIKDFLAKHDVQVSASTISRMIRKVSDPKQ